MHIPFVCSQTNPEFVLPGIRPKEFVTFKVCINKLTVDNDDWRYLQCHRAQIRKQANDQLSETQP